MAGEVVVITGCSSGFGLLTAVKAAQAGYRVVATLRDLSKRAPLDVAAAEAKVSLDVRALDVDDLKAMPAFVAAVEKDVGPIDILVNNAGFGMGGTVFDLTMDELRSQLETNFFGAIALTKAVLPAMIQRRRGLILQISSNSSRHSSPGMGAYCASKAALDAITESLRLEVRPFNIRVTSVQPGMFRTSVFQKRRLAQSFGKEGSPFRAMSEKGLTRMDQIVERKASDPDAVAELVVRMFKHPRPRARQLVGLDAKLQGWLRFVMPERAWEWFIRTATGFDA
jgi:NAD(P)-dependent dehydrogenase (short-subunit alcohol dehydrogenase family)